MRSSSPVVNVCFHGIGTPERRLEPGEAPYWVSESAFHRILDEVTGRPDVRLSFDDGNSSDVAIGLPALVERDLRATFFVLAGRLGERGSLGAEDVHELLSHGMAIGSHGMDHRPWRHLDPETRERELVGAREILADLTQTPVGAAAVPLGRYDRALLARLRRLGYRSVHTSDRRWATAEGWLQPRFSVRSQDTVRSLRAEVLTPPPLMRTVELRAVGLLKRLR